MSTLTPPQPVQPVSLTQPPSDLPVGSPEWWVYDLEAEMEVRNPLIWLYEDYYEGRHKLTFASSRFRQAFGQMLQAISDNWIPLIIGSSTERLKPQGFLFGDNQEGDDEAWSMWQENFLDADAPLGFVEACKHAESYLLVWPEQTNGFFSRLVSRRSGTSVRITVEHPSQFIVRRRGGDRRLREAALKRWMESDGSCFATLYLPDATYRYERGQNGQWVPRPGVEFKSTNRLGIVPGVPIVNDPQMLPSLPPTALTSNPHNVSISACVGLGRSDQADAISTVDQINKLICDMMVASEIAAYRQRWATGLDIPRYPADESDPNYNASLVGQPMEPFKAAVDRLWVAEGEDGERVKFGEFGATDLENYTKAIEHRIQSLAARTRTPPHYLLGSIVNVSGDALKAAEAGLASKVEGKKASFGEALEEAIRLAFAWKGDPRKDDMSAQVDWAPSEARSESEFIDSLVKKMALGVPKEQLWRDAGYSPQEIQRFKSALLEESILNPPPPAPGLPPAEEPEPEPPGE